MENEWLVKITANGKYMASRRLRAVTLEINTVTPICYIHCYNQYFFTIMKTKFVDLTLEQKSFVIKKYECHFDDILTNNCLTWVLSPTEILKSDAWQIALVFFIGQHLDRTNLDLTEKFEWLREVSICIIEDAKDKEWYELANNFEMFIWFCEQFVANQKSKPIPFVNSNKSTNEQYTT